MKKLLTSFIIGFSLILSFAPFSAVKAQTTWYNQTFPEWYLKVYDNTNPNEIFGERYTAAQVQWIVYSIPSLLINIVLDGNTDLGSFIMGVHAGVIDLEKGKDAINTSIEGLISKFQLPTVYLPEAQSNTSITSKIFAYRPLSGISYARGVVNKLNPVSTVNAAEPGVGANQALYAVAFLWKATRNISFFLFVLVAVVFAFMIMFRVKLSPQTVVSVQSALPKIIITLILVTFSYAIAGLMVDLMYVVMGIFSTLAAGVFSGSGFFGRIVPGTIFNFINGSIFSMNDSATALLIYFVIYLVLFVIAWVFAIVASLLSFNVSSFLFSVVLAIFFIILIFILIWYLLKVTFVLFKTLAEVFGLVIIGPLQITIGALYPQAGFGPWLRKLVSKLMVFPLTGMLIFLSYILMIDSIGISVYSFYHDNIFLEVWNTLMKMLNGIGIPLANSAEVRSLWGPPMLGNAGGATPIAFMLMSIGLIMMLPKISESIESFLAGKGIAGTGIGEAMGPFGTLGKTAGGIAMGTLTEKGAGLASGRLNEYINKLSSKEKLKPDSNTKKVLEGISSILKGMGTHK